MLRTLKYLGFILVLAPILLVGQCVYIESSQSSNLKSLCESSGPGKKLSGTLQEAKKARFEVRGDFTESTNENDWFDREYHRILKWVKKNNGVSGAYTVVFAKPGMGYYACIIRHENGLITENQFADRSS